MGGEHTPPEFFQRGFVLPAIAKKSFCIFIMNFLTAGSFFWWMAQSHRKEGAATMVRNLTEDLDLIRQARELVKGAV
jgi:hypothetical protein